MPDENESAEVVGTEEVGSEQALRTSRRIDPGIIEIALGVTAIAAVVATQATSIVVRAFAAIAFILSAVSAAELYSVYLMSRIPAVGLGLRGYLPLARRWVRLLTNALVGETPIQEYETLGLLNLLAGFVLLMFVIAGWVAISFFP